ncbi:MFS transporter [Photobacterium sp. TY1-4]|uniref:MFS transporter n=1 Tax=Photobacterium sp. TY1-4 TaxID=2899122 RepID=UPI0021C0A5F0|nr:MFS transporter [Photobacterium sp. TY1-4]UXI02517.1 MFS transporter [Photobacterium sp. TY1-4]
MSYYLYILSHLASIVAFRCATIVTIWAFVQSTAGAESVGILVASMWIANILFLPASGYLLDKYPKKTIILVSSIFSVIASITLLKAYDTLIACIVTISFLAVFNSAISSAPNAIIPRLVSKERLTKAIGISSTLNSLQVIIGVVIGGGVIYAIGVHSSLVVTAVLYATSLVLFLFVQIPSTGPVKSSEDQGALRMIAGFRSLKILKPEVMFCCSAMVGNFVLTPLISIIVPIYVQQALGNNIEYVVLFESAIAVGMIVGGMTSVKISSWMDRYHQVLLGGVFIGIGVICFAWAELIYFKAFALFISGLGLTMKGIPFSSLRGHAVPHDYKARIESAIFSLCILTIPIGSFVFSYAIDLDIISIDALVMFMGVLIILSLSFITQSRESVRVLRTTDNELEHYYTTHYPEAFK